MKTTPYLALAALIAGLGTAACGQPESEVAGGPAPSVIDTPAPAQVRTAPPPTIVRSPQPQPPQGPIPDDFDGIAAERVIDLAFTYGEQSLKAPADYANALLDHKGCAVEFEFKVARGYGRAEGGLHRLIDDAKASGAVVKSEQLAQEALVAFEDAFLKLDDLCVARNEGDIALARQLVTDGLMVRTALGLPLPKK